MSPPKQLRKENFWQQHRVRATKSHNEGTWFTCDICQQQFITRDNLKQHSLRRHEDVKPYVCSECPKCFCTSRELRSHHLVHLDVKNFSCCLCNKSFKRPWTFVKHFKSCVDHLWFNGVFYAYLCISPWFDCMSTLECESTWDIDVAVLSVCLTVTRF